MEIIRNTLNFGTFGHRADVHIKYVDSISYALHHSLRRYYVSVHFPRQLMYVCALIDVHTH